MNEKKTITIRHSGSCAEEDKSSARKSGQILEYIPFPDDGSTRKNMTFIKNSNQCRYLFEVKCNLRKECQIYKDAEERIKLDISDMKF